MYGTIPTVLTFVSKRNPVFSVLSRAKLSEIKYLSEESCYLALCVYQLMKAGAGGYWGRVSNSERVKEEPVSSGCTVYKTLQ